MPNLHHQLMNVVDFLVPELARWIIRQQCPVRVSLRTANRPVERRSVVEVFPNGKRRVLAGQLSPQLSFALGAPSRSHPKLVSRGFVKASPPFSGNNLRPCRELHIQYANVLNAIPSPHRPARCIFFSCLVGVPSSRIKNRTRTCRKSSAAARAVPAGAKRKKRREVREIPTSSRNGELQAINAQPVGPRADNHRRTEHR